MELADDGTLVANQARAVARSNVLYQSCYAFLSLLGFGVAVAISLPLAVIVAIVLALLRQFWVAYEVSQQVRRKDEMARTYLMDTNKDIADKMWKQVLDPVIYGTIPLEIYAQEDFWVALAGVPLPEQAIRAALTKYDRLREEEKPSALPLSHNNARWQNIQKMREEEYNARVDEKLEERKNKTDRDKAKIDFDFLNYTVEFVEVGSRSTFALQKVTDYAVVEFKLGPDSVFKSLNSVIEGANDENSIVSMLKRFINSKISRIEAQTAAINKGTPAKTTRQSRHENPTAAPMLHEDIHINMKF